MADTDRPTLEISDKTRKAVSGALDAMTKWREDIETASKAHGDEVLDKLKAAARAAGWPDALTETTKSQLMQASKIQTEMLDHIIQAWQQYLKAPTHPTGLQATLSRGAANEPNEIAKLALAPAEYWMQALGMWQRNWATALAAWTKSNAQRRMDDLNK